MSDYGFSDIECKIICAQIERRMRLRQEFLKLRTDPCKHAQEAGYVFDPAMQKFLSMKTCQFDSFHANSGSLMKALSFMIPMFLYGLAVYTVRTKKEKELRCGKIKYRDRSFKFL